MAAIRRRVNDLTLEQRLRYWRGIRLDFPQRKAEALRHIDALLDEMLAAKAADGT